MVHWIQEYGDNTPASTYINVLKPDKVLAPWQLYSTTESVWTRRAIVIEDTTRVKQVNE